MTLDFVKEFLYEYEPGKPCYAVVFGGVERLLNGNTIVNYAFCVGDNAAVDGKYSYAIEYDNNANIVAKLKTDVDAGYKPARGIYRAPLIPGIGNEYEI